MKQTKTPRMNVYRIVLMALLVAIEIVCNRFLSIRTPIVTIGFGFVAIALAAVLFGPVRGAVVGGMADFLGAVLFPIGAYFPGFTLSAALTGAIYGFFLHERTPRLRRTLAAVLLAGILCSLLLDTYWLYLITGKGVLALLPARLIKFAVMTPIQVLVVQTITSQGARLSARIP